MLNILFNKELFDNKYIFILFNFVHEFYSFKVDIKKNLIFFNKWEFIILIHGCKRDIL